MQGETQAGVPPEARTANACAIANTRHLTSWAGTIDAPVLRRGGINLTALFAYPLPCFSTFMSQHALLALRSDAQGLLLAHRHVRLDLDQEGTTPVAAGPSPSRPAVRVSRTSSSVEAVRSSSRASARRILGHRERPSERMVAQSLACTAQRTGTSASTPPGATANITLGFLGDVVCTYTNKRQPLLTLVKRVVNDNRGTAVAGAWTLGATGRADPSRALRTRRQSRARP